MSTLTKLGWLRTARLLLDRVRPDWLLRGRDRRFGGTLDYRKSLGQGGVVCHFLRKLTILRVFFTAVFYAFTKRSLGVF
jgi:hypothetical protein